MTGPSSRRRKAVFDPTALDDIDDTLAPPAQSTASADDQPGAEPGSGVSAPPVPAEPQPAKSPATESSAAGPAARSTSSGSSERGASGRPRPSGTSGARPPAPTRQPRSARGRIPSAVRLPADLYREVNDVLLSGPERPSYGQLVMWTVEDHRGEIAAQVAADLPDPADRIPRGRKLAQDRVPVGLQLLSSERDDLDDLAAEVADRHDGARVTRTDVAIAALTVALRVSSNRPV